MNKENRLVFVGEVPEPFTKAKLQGVNQKKLDAYTKLEDNKKGFKDFKSSKEDERDSQISTLKDMSDEQLVGRYEPSAEVVMAQMQKDSPEKYKYFVKWQEEMKGEKNMTPKDSLMLLSVMGVSGNPEDLMKNIKEKFDDLRSNASVAVARDMRTKELFLIRQEHLKDVRDTREEMVGVDSKAFKDFEQAKKDYLVAEKAFNDFVKYQKELLKEAYTNLKGELAKKWQTKKGELANKHAALLKEYNEAKQGYENANQSWEDAKDGFKSAKASLERVAKGKVDALNGLDDKALLKKYDKDMKPDVVDRKMRDLYPTQYKYYSMWTQNKGDLGLSGMVTFLKDMGIDGFDKDAAPKIQAKFDKMYGDAKLAEAYRMRNEEIKGIKGKYAGIIERKEQTLLGSKAKEQYGKTKEAFAKKQKLADEELKQMQADALEVTDLELRLSQLEGMDEKAIAQDEGVKTKAKRMYAERSGAQQSQQIAQKKTQGPKGTT